MKKLFTLIIVAGLALTMQAQHITNTLGQDGFFYIESENYELVSFGNYSGTGYSYTEFAFYNENNFDTDFDIYNAGGSLDLNLMKSNGDSDNPSNVVTGDILGNINFSGSLGNLQAPSATISAGVDGAPGSFVPGELIFKTGTASAAPETRMTINKSGTVAFSNDIVVAGNSNLSGSVTLNNSLDVDGAVILDNTLYVSGSATLGASVSFPVSAGGNAILDANDYTYFLNTTGGEVTLPTAVGIAGRVYIIKSTTGTGTVQADGTETIDGLPGFPLIAQYKYVKVQSNGSQWYIIGQN